jgi:hypothetical protein
MAGSLLFPGIVSGSDPTANPVIRIFASTVIHGLTATATVETPDREAAEGRG